MKNHFIAQVGDKSIHQCTSYHKGDETVWKCPQCPEYERTFNWLTNRMRVKGQNEHLHTGMNTGEQNLEALTENLCQN